MRIISHVNGRRQLQIFRRPGTSIAALYLIVSTTHQSKMQATCLMSTVPDMWRKNEATASGVKILRFQNSSRCSSGRRGRCGNWARRSAALDMIVAPWSNGGSPSSAMLGSLCSSSSVSLCDASAVIQRDGLFSHGGCYIRMSDHALYFCDPISILCVPLTSTGLLLSRLVWCCYRHNSRPQVPVGHQHKTTFVGCLAGNKFLNKRCAAVLLVLDLLLLENYHWNRLET
jgi:hypothetical protein